MSDFLPGDGGSGRRLVPRSLLTSSEGWSLALPLSPRECEIARLTARDLTNKEIGAVLEISEWTVAAHLRRIFGKLNVHSKAAMVARVLDVVATARWRELTHATAGYEKVERTASNSASRA